MVEDLTKELYYTERGSPWKKETKEKKRKRKVSSNLRYEIEGGRNRLRSVNATVIYAGEI